VGGGSVTLSSASFATAQADPVVVAGADTLDVLRIDPTSFSVRLPVAPSGLLSLQVARGSARYDAGTVQIYGFAHRAEVSPGFGPTMLVLGKQGTDPMVIGEDVADGPINLLNLVDGTMTEFGDMRTPGGHYGPGITASADQFILIDTVSKELGVWTLWPQLQKLGPTASPGVTYARLAARMTDTTWLFAYNHWTNTIGPAAVTQLKTEDPWALAISPRGDRTAMTMASTLLPGAPVFNSATGDTAFTIDGVRSVRSVEFSPDGSELFLLGNSWHLSSDTLLVLDATSGERLRVAALPDLTEARALANDPNQNLLYVQVVRGCDPFVLVYDRTSLEILGEMAAPGGAPVCANGSWEGLLVVDRLRQSLHLIWQGKPAPVWTFDLMN
jgi:hypothetical protein